MTIPSVETVQRACGYAAENFDKVDNGVFLQDIYNTVKVTRVYDDSEGVRTVEFLVHTPQRFDNGMDMVHGGASSSLCAIFSTLVLAGDDKLWPNSQPTTADLENFVKSIGYTRALDVQILQAVPLNSEIRLKAQIISRTKSNAFTTASIYNQTGRLLVRASHDMIQRSYEPKIKDDPQHFHAKFHLAKL